MPDVLRLWFFARISIDVFEVKRFAENFLVLKSTIVLCMRKLRRTEIAQVFTLPQGKLG